MGVTRKTMEIGKTRQLRETEDSSETWGDSRVKAVKAVKGDRVKDLGEAMEAVSKE